jgi:hypothetical protein
MTKKHLFFTIAGHNKTNFGGDENEVGTKQARMNFNEEVELREGGTARGTMTQPMMSSEEIWSLS